MLINLLSVSMHESLFWQALLFLHSGSLLWRDAWRGQVDVLTAFAETEWRQGLFLFKSLCYFSVPSSNNQRILRAEHMDAIYANVPFGKTPVAPSFSCPSSSTSSSSSTPSLLFPNHSLPLFRLLFLPLSLSFDSWAMIGPTLILPTSSRWISLKQRCHVTRLPGWYIENVAYRL